MNAYEFLKKTDSLVKLVYPSDEEEGSPRRHYEKWNDFFSKRLSGNGTASEISKNYLRGLESSKKTRSVCGTDDSYKGDWKNIGAKNFVQTYQNQGMVTDIWVDPADVNFIYIATEGGGLWKSTNGGTDWTNISDNNNLSLGSIGINVMAVNPSDRDDIYISTALYKHFNNNMMGNAGNFTYGLGIYHTTNGGTTWSKETNGLTNPDFFAANDIKFSSTKVNGKNYVILTQFGDWGSDKVFTKFDNNAWVDITPSGLTPSFKPLMYGSGAANTADVLFLHDIEFNNDIPNTFFISSIGVWNGCAGIWKFVFDNTNGNVTNTTEILNSKFNGQSVHSGATTFTDPVMGNTLLEFGSNKHAFIATTLMSDGVSNSWICDGLNPNYSHCKETFITEWDFNTTPITYIQTLRADMYTTMSCFEFNKNNPNMFYMGEGAGLAFMVYKDGAVWKYKALENYGQPNSEWSQPEFPIHPDIRRIYIQKSANTNPLKPGIDDVVFWGTDGGISKTNMHDITKIVNHNALNISTSEVKNDIRIALNLNGNNLYIGDCYDVDIYKNKFLASSSYHDGYQLWNKTTNTWHGAVFGDGMTARFERRDALNSATNQRIIYKPSGLNQIISWNPSSTNPIAINYSSISGAESGNFRYTPVEFDNDILKLSVLRPWRSGSNNYSFPSGNNILSNFTTLNFAAAGSQNCVAFTEKNANDAYFVRFQHGGGANIVNRRKFNGAAPDWNDITPVEVYNSPYGLPCSDLITDPNNFDRVWIALANIYPYNNFENEKNRVMYSPDGGVTPFVDMSKGLSCMPVNCLVYQKGTDDIIYAGTDEGVYYWNKPTNCWIKMSKNFPNTMVTRLVINYCKGTLIAATYGRGIWESNLINFEQNNVSLPLVTNTITTNETWSADKYIDGSIIIKSGATLTIQGSANSIIYTSTTTIHMPKYGAIYNEKGGKLLIDGAKLTNECGDMWYGIQAYGDGISSQSMTSGLYANQGYLELKNTAILENVEEAFTNAGGSDLPLNTGGVINANKAIIRNARRCAQFLKYQNIQTGGALSADKSKFLDCKFIVDKTIHHNSPLITMWAVRGLELEGCQFINSANLDQGHENGIGTLDASYWIHNSANQNTLFEGLQVGLQSSSYSWNDKLQYPITVEGALFDKNETGIDFRDMLYPVIKGNTFYTGMVQHPYNPAGDFYPTWGSRLTNVSDYIYCSNNHSWPYPTPPNVTTWNCGVDITNAGVDDVVVEKNNFDGMQVGTCVAEVNGSQTAKTGINLRWNKNINNKEFDFVFGGNAIIRPIQTADFTSNSVATGNTFTGNLPTMDWGHWPGGNAPADYYYNPSNTNEIPTNIFGVNPISTTNILSEPLDCAKYITVHKVKRGLLTTTEFYALIAEYNFAETNYNVVNTLYNQLIDGGNTEATEQDIENTTSAEIMQLRADMLAHSPYLSLDVLQTLAEENILPQAILLEIILANPEGSQSEEFVRYLQFEKPNPMPTYMINMIKATWSGATVRSILEKTLMQHQEIMEAKKSEIIMAARVNGSFLTDAELLSWVQKMPTVKSQYELVEYYLANKNYTSANSILTNIPVAFRMTAQDLDDYTAYTNFYNFKKNLLENNIEINNLDSPKIQILKTIADANQNTFARSMARNTLCFFYNICYPMPHHTFNSNSSNRMALPTNNQLSSEIKVYPNPAKDYIVFEYSLENGDEAKSLLITDIVGNSIYNTNLSKSKGQYIYNSTNLNSGTFIYYITTNNGLKKSGTFVIKK